VFADRTYQDNGSLTPRDQPNALIQDETQALQQALQMIKQGVVTSTNGNNMVIMAETICLHSDGEHALSFAKTIHETLKHHGIEIVSL
jgi:UPF0271 protein